MIPDTTNYMIAGFAVILGGILIYIVTIYQRMVKVKKDAVSLLDLEQDP